MEGIGRARGGQNRLATPDGKLWGVQALEASVLRVLGVPGGLVVVEIDIEIAKAYRQNQLVTMFFLEDWYRRGRELTM